MKGEPNSQLEPPSVGKASPHLTERKGNEARMAEAAAAAVVAEGGGSCDGRRVETKEACTINIFPPSWLHL